MDTPGMDYETLTGTRSQERIDAENLNTLTLCHYIAGGLIALVSSVFIIHIVMGTMMIHNPGAFAPPVPPPAAPGQTHPMGQPYPVTPYPFFPPGMGYLFVTMGSVAVLGGWTLGGLTAYAGRCLKARKNYVFILVVAALDGTLVMPLGTLLGVFTFIVLMRPAVKALFKVR